MPKLEQRLAAWKPAPVPAKNIAHVDRPKQSMVYLIDKPDAMQSVIIAGGIAPKIDASQEVALETLNDIFGGTFGSRMNMNLREDKHWSYGSQSVLLATTAQRPYVSFAPGADRQDQGISRGDAKGIQGVVGARTAHRGGAGQG